MIEATSTSLTPMDTPTRAKLSTKPQPDRFAKELERVTRRSDDESGGTGEQAPKSVNDDARELADSDSSQRRVSDAAMSAKQDDVSLPWVTHSQVSQEPSPSSRGERLLGGRELGESASQATEAKSALHPGSGGAVEKPAETLGAGSDRKPVVRVGVRAAPAREATITLGAPSSETPHAGDKGGRVGNGTSDRLLAGDATKHPAHAGGGRLGILAAGTLEEQTSQKRRTGDEGRASTERKSLREMTTSWNEAAPMRRGLGGEGREAAHLRDRVPSDAQEGWRHSVVAGLNSGVQRQAKANPRRAAARPVAEATLGALPSNAGPLPATGPSQVRQITPVLKSSEVSNWLPKAQVMVQDGGGFARFEVEVVSGKKATLEVRVADGVMDARLMLDLGDDPALARRLLDDVRTIASGAGLDAGEFAFQHGANREPSREGNGQTQQLALGEPAPPANSLRRSTSSGLINIVI